MCGLFEGATSTHKLHLKNALHNCQSLVGHTRFATHGSVTDSVNNHPHLYANAEVVGAVTHNGVISHHEHIAKTNDLTMQGECDSEIIARLLESFDPELSLVERVADAVNECDDWDSIALAVLESKGDVTDMVLVARGNPVKYSIHNGVLYYASTSTMLPSTVQTLKEGSILHIREGVGILDTVDGLLEEYATTGLTWQTYGARSSTAKKVVKTCQPVQTRFDGHDSFDDYYLSNNIERDWYSTM